MSGPTLHESVWLALDADTLRAVDELARRRGITRHESARVLLRLGVETSRRAERREPPPGRRT